MKKNSPSTIRFIMFFFGFVLVSCLFSFYVVTGSISYTDGSLSLRNNYRLYAFAGIFIFLLLVSLVRLILNSVNLYHDRRLLLFFIILTTMLPGAVMILYLFSHEILLFELLPAITAVSSLILPAIGLKMDVFDYMYIPRREIMNRMDNGLAIIRDDDVIIDCNSAFARICNVDKMELLGKSIYEILIPVSDNSNSMNNVNIFKSLVSSITQTVREIELKVGESTNYFEIMVKPVFGRNRRLKGRLFRMNELSREKELRKLLADQNRQLAAANHSLRKRTKMAADLKRMTVRNQLAREIHDQLGHTIIMTLSALEQIEKKSNENERWLEIDKLSENVRMQLQRSIGSKTTELSNDQLSVNHTSIKNVLNEIKQEAENSGIRVNYDIQGSVLNIPDTHIHDLQQICREAATNSVKHGHADQLDYFLQITDTSYDLVIVDNGRSVSEYSKGFGLTNMESRVENLGGHIRFQNDSGGFAIFIKIPLSKQ
ncbi:MAG: PAS domain-containing protein [Eubacteriales bacterium]|nr:PAS domain-containing protein [Eubacteriales bacterium]